jgi:hypothetical protein
MNKMNDTCTTTVSSLSQEQARDKLLGAASRASNLWNDYASIDPYQEATTIPGGQNPWKNPDRIIGELSECRNELVHAWNEWDHATGPSSSEEEEDSSRPAGDTTDKNIQSLFLEMMTDTFQDTLEQMRIQSSSSTSPNAMVMDSEDLPLDILVDCLQSTIDLFTPHELHELLNTVECKGGQQQVDDKSMIGNPSTINGAVSSAHQRHQERWDHYMD